MTRNDLKVALISHEFPPYIIGGIASHCYDLAYNLAKKQISTKVICGTIHNVQERTKINQFLEIIRLPVLNYPPRYLWFQLLNHKAFCKLTSDCNVIHGVNPTSSLSVALHFKAKKALIMTHHLNELQTLKTCLQMPLSELTFGDLMINVLSYPLDDILEKTWFNYADRIIVPGFTTFQFMKQVYPSNVLAKVSVVYNAINFEKIQPLNCCNQSLKNETTTIVSFSRLVSVKGIGQLLLHIKKIFHIFPNVRLEIFGDGPLRPILAKRVEKEGLSKNVKIMGHMKYVELLFHVRKASLAVFPTFLEVGPFISALEAMALKKPIVVFDFPFNREFVKHMETGVMAKAGDMEDFIDKIVLLLSSEDLRIKIGENAFKYVEQNHNWERIVNNYIEIYKQAISS